MNTILKKVSTFGVLALSLFLWSCDNIGQSTGPGTNLDPTGYAIFSSTTGEQFVVTRADEDLGSVSASIGAAGGQLFLGTHSLLVPAGAVSEATVFTMSRSDDDLVRFRLSATRETHNDIGSAGFPVPVKLTLDFSHASDMPDDASTLKVIYFRPDGLVDPQPTSLDVDGQKASGDLPHFSDFGLAWPW